MKLIFLLHIAFIFLVFNAQAQAACSSPAGQASQTRYDFTANNLYYCNDTEWVEMGGSSSIAPSDMKLTTAANNGNFGGFSGMKSFIEANGCAGYQVCTVYNIYRFIENGGTPPSESAWTFPTGGNFFSTCNSWTSSDNSGTYRGHTWGSNVISTTCSTVLKVACCKF